MAKTWGETKFTERDRTTEDSHDWLKENYKRFGFKSAASFLEHIINEYKNDNVTQKLSRETG